MNRAELSAGLKLAGVKRGMRLMVHSSLKSLGHVEGGPKTVIGCLKEAVGPAGLLLMPTFNHGEPFKPGGEGIFDPGKTPTTDGIIPETFWRMPDVRRSLNPTHAYAAWGADAARFLEGHHLTLTMGEDSPLGLLAREGGCQLNLGTTHAASTAKHVAETMRRVPCLGYRGERYPVRMPDGRIVPLRTWGWRAQSCPLTESGKLIEEKMEFRRAQARSMIGPSPVVFMRVWDLLEAVWELLDAGYGGFPPCSECGIRPQRTSATVPADFVPEKPVSRPPPQAGGEFP